MTPIKTTEQIEQLARKYADNEGSCWTNDYNGFITGYTAALSSLAEGQGELMYKIEISDIKTWYAAECESCGWIGSSEFMEGGHAIADTGDFSDPLCPICGSKEVDGSDDEHGVKSLAEKLTKANRATKYFRENYERVADEYYGYKLNHPTPAEQQEAETVADDYPGEGYPLSRDEWEMEKVVDIIRSKETTLECFRPLRDYIEKHHTNPLIAGHASASAETGQLKERIRELEGGNK